MGEPSTDLLVLKLGPLVGHGASSQVYQAKDRFTGQEVAVKKSRVSLRVKRTLLQYEARVLQTLRGHPAIPLVYAFGRFEHFEYISMELLGPSIGDVKGQSTEVRKRIAPQLAVQMISALEHVHSHGLVHRDIKPGNIVLCSTDRRFIRLIDFGLAYQYHGQTVPIIGPGLEAEYVLGTLPYASLHAHRGFALTRRDDLESLAYTLFSILLGRLPWDKPYIHTSTRRGDRRQVLAKKQAWSGGRLAEGYEAAFGQFLDEMRGLEFNETPSYDHWRKAFAGISEGQGAPLSFDFGATVITADGSESDTSESSRPSPLHVVEPGQLVYIQLMPRITIEGYTIGQGDPFYWLDPSLSDEAWPTVPLPAIVLEVKGNWWGKSVVTVVPITRRRLGESITKALLLVDGRCEEPDATIVIGSDWPQDPTWCYSYMGSNTFLCDPDQREVVPTHWKIAEDTLSALRSRFHLELDAAATDLPPLAIRRMETFSQIYVRVHALGPDTLTHTASGLVTDWESERGWFEQLDPILKRRALDCEIGYVLTEYQKSDDEGKERHSDSYWADDFTIWRGMQQEKDFSLSLGPADPDYDKLDTKLPVISSIE